MISPIIHMVDACLDSRPPYKEAWNRGKVACMDVVDAWMDLA